MTPAERAVLDAARPACLREGCEQPVLRVEFRHERQADNIYVPVATAVCEFGHREEVEPA